VTARPSSSGDRSRGASEAAEFVELERRYARAERWSRITMRVGLALLALAAATPLLGLGRVPGFASLELGERAIAVLVAAAILLVVSVRLEGRAHQFVVRRRRVEASSAPAPRVPSVPTEPIAVRRTAPEAGELERMGPIQTAAVIALVVLAAVAAAALSILLGRGHRPFVLGDDGARGLLAAWIVGVAACLGALAWASLRSRLRRKGRQP
jgi:hypothetical protein